MCSGCVKFLYLLLSSGYADSGFLLLMLVLKYENAFVCFSIQPVPYFTLESKLGMYGT